MAYSKYFNIRTYNAALLYVPIPKVEPLESAKPEEPGLPNLSVVSGRTGGKPSLEELILAVAALSAPNRPESDGN